MLMSVIFQDKKTSEEFYEIYHRFFVDIPDELFEDAVRLAVMNSKFFPTIAEIRSRIPELARTLEREIDGRMDRIERKALEDEYARKHPEITDGKR